jgi:exosortase/archaeosortase
MASPQPCVHSPGVRDQSRTGVTLVLRLVLSFVAVVICYRFDWLWLKTITASLNLRLDNLAGVPLQRLSADTVRLGAVTFRYVIACTFADVWCASIALIWKTREPVARNLEYLAVFTLGLFVLNVVRLSAADVLYAAGVSWSLAEGVIGGLAYFAVWLAILRRNAWN